MRLFLAALSGLTVGLLLSSNAEAVTYIIGDPDGFGIEPSGLVRASSSHVDPADVDGDGILEPGEYLPDWDANGSCAIGSNDTFDFREPDELNATDGAQWTDYSVEGGGAADGATFRFQFPVPSPGDFDYEDPHFVNFVFGDYDVSPTEVSIDGNVVVLNLQGSGNDGLIQSAFAGVRWEAMLDGEIVVEVLAPGEPYLAFDYVFLDTTRLADGDGDGVPGSIDNCPGVVNLDQADADQDGIGDVCDPCPEDNDPTGEDSDEDGLGDVCDPCPYDPTNDSDGDGFCAPDDCDPDDGEIHPDAHEICDDGIDNDCEGTVDFFEDIDGDGYGICSGDCDEGDPEIHAGADEGCNGIDNDCDGLLGAMEIDSDGDGFTDCDGDCDDFLEDVYPGAPTFCDSNLDADCNGTIDGEENTCLEDDGATFGSGCSCSSLSGSRVEDGALFSLGILLLGLLLTRRIE